MDNPTLPYKEDCIDRKTRPLEILSLASGYCGHEIDIARQMTRPYKLTCTELIEPIFEKARAVAKTEGLAINFDTVDLNFITIEPERYDLIFAHAAIHHVINLEHLFEQIKWGLSPMGILFLGEVVGKNRKLIWDENERYANALLDLIPDRVTRGVRIATPEDLGGMEGIRQEDILPLLREHFSTVFEYRHGAFIRFICTHSELGPAFDPQHSETRRYLDFLIESDDCSVRSGILRPLEIWGAYKPIRVRDSKPYRTEAPTEVQWRREMPPTGAEHFRIRELESQIATLQSQLAVLRKSRLLKMGRMLRRVTGQAVPY
jgi:Methyltransferase domain